MPVLPKATPEETLALFGNGQIVFGMKRRTSSAPKSEAATPASPATSQGSKLHDLQNLPQDPATAARKQSEAAFKARSTTGAEEG